MPIVDDVQAHLEYLGIIGGSSGFASVRRRVTDDAPDAAVFITEDGGTAPELPGNGGAADAALARVGVQVRVRAEPWDGDSAAAKAREIIAALHGLADPVLGSTRYLGVRALTPEGVFIGYDDRGRPEFTAAFRAQARVADLFPSSV